MEVPEYFVGACYFGSGGDHFSPEKRHADQKPTGGETFAVDDLLDFSHADAIISSDNNGFLDNVAATGNSSTGTAAAGGGDSCNSSNNNNNRNFSSNFAPHQISGELCVPYDDMAELEWLSNIVEESFTGQDELKTLHLLSGKPQTPESSSSSETLPPFDTSSRNAAFLPTETPLPGKARSKRSRPPPGDWSTRFLHVVTPPKTAKAVKKRERSDNNNNNSDSMGRRCLHCAAEKTRQWRTGPMGPKTLCNACGVRYKSGRLVPEYRPAASPTFMSTKHSNSHRKVLELRRQKDLQRQQHQQLMSQQAAAAAASIFGVSNGGDHHHEFFIRQHHCGGPNYRHIM